MAESKIGQCKKLENKIIQQERKGDGVVEPTARKKRQGLYRE
jgi:hypothetical protein